VIDLKTFVSRASSIYSKATLKRKIKVLKMYDKFLEENNLKPGVESLAKWMDYMRDKVSNQSLGVYAKDVISYFDIMLMDIDDRKIKSLKMMIPRPSFKQPDVLTAEEVRRIIEVSDYPYKLIFALSFTYARRLNEVLNCKVDLEKKKIIFPILKRKREEYAEFEIEPWIREMIEEYLELYPKASQKNLFKISDRAVEIAFKRYCKEAGINMKGRKITFHSLRHSIISILVERGVPIEIIGKVLAKHVSISTTYQYYTSPTKGMMEKIPRVQDILFYSATAEKNQ